MCKHPSLPRLNHATQKPIQDLPPTVEINSPCVQKKRCGTSFRSVREPSLKSVSFQEMQASIGVSVLQEFEQRPSAGTLRRAVRDRNVSKSIAMN